MTRRLLGLLALVGLLVGCDHASKRVAYEALRAAPPIALFPGVSLRYAANDDTAFSLLHAVPLATRGALVIAASLLGLVAVGVAWWRRRRAPLADHVAFALVLAGALGNLVDRVFRGFVVDFIALPHWPVFNVADVAIVLGGAWLLLRGVGARRASAADPPRA